MSFLFVAALTLCVGCFRQDHRTIEIQTPQLRSTNCFELVQAAIKSVDGIEYAVPHYEEGTLSITYNAMKLGIRNIEFVIAGAGFDANDTKAPPSVRVALPEGCR